MAALMDRSAWSGEGEFTASLLQVLSAIGEIAVIKVQDAPPGAADGYSAFIGNDIFVGFRLERAATLRWVGGMIPVPVISERKSLTLKDLGRVLEQSTTAGAPDYADDQMMQYLRTERVEAPYQQRSQKIVELVRIYEALPQK